MLECMDLVKKYHNSTVVSVLSFVVGRGEVFGLLGANGAGKTTTIKMILGLTPLTGGKIIIQKETRIGYSPETPYFHPFLTGYEVMRFYSRLQKMGKHEAEKQVGELLGVVGLTEAGNKKVKTYSKGMLQRLAMAQALLGDPDLLILDEPTSGLDALGRVEMLQLIHHLKCMGKTILLNSHILGDVEKAADRVVIINNGIKVREVDFKSNRTGSDLESIFIESLGGIRNDCIDH